MADWNAYLRELREVRGQPEATAELSLRTAIVNLLRDIAPPGVTVFPEASSDEGQPDLIAKRGPLVVGYGETKAPGPITALERRLTSEQIIGYRRLPNFLLTDYLHFLLMRDGVEVARGSLIATADLDAGRLNRAHTEAAEELLSIWLSAAPAQITSPERLALELARRAAWLRDGIRSELAREADAAADEGREGPLRSLHAFYRQNLMSDMDAEMFADTYAQTVAYGLFVARFHLSSDTFDRGTAEAAIPASTAFLRSSVRFLLDEDTVPRGVSWIIEDLVATLRATADELIARAAAVKGAGDDAVLYFYEHFLQAYDRGERMDRGVYYTHPPLVEYTIRAIDDVLGSSFGIAGLADERVRVLDPAVGTGTFLLAAAERAVARAIETEGEAVVPALVGEHLLPHLYGFELLPAPYAISHLKLGSYFAQAGHEPAVGERVQVYLTNTLAEPIEPVGALLPAIGALVAEARAADEVKRDVPILVITGNPPWAVASHNKEHIGDLMGVFLTVDGQPLGENNIRPLDDDYLRFLRWSVWKLLEQPGAPGQGVIALVTNSGMVSRPVMRGVRRFLLDRFDEIRILDLHGNQRDWFRDRTDEKVFPDVQVGVSISLFIRRAEPGDGPAQVWYRETRGTVEEKFAYLAAASTGDDGWTRLEPVAPFYAFIPQNVGEEYRGWPSVIELMPERSPGVISHRDKLSVAITEDELLPKMRQFADMAIADEEVEERYELNSNPRWILRRRRDALGGIVDRAKVKPLLYRPFDRRVIYDDVNVVGDRRERLREHLARVPNNIALVTARSATPEAAYTFITRVPGTQALLSSRTLGAAVYLPLYLAAATGQDALLPLGEDEQGFAPNIDPGWLEVMRDAYGDAWSPEALIGYLYGVLASDTYRERVADALSNDFPRVPLTADSAAFAAASDLGTRLAALHMREAEPDAAAPRLVGAGDLTVANPRHDAEQERLWINATQYLTPVSTALVATAVGGYAVLLTWLRHREGRRLSRAEVREFAAIAASLEAAAAIREELEPQVEAVLEGEVLKLEG